MTRYYLQRFYLWLVAAAGAAVAFVISALAHAANPRIGVGVMVGLGSVLVWWFVTGRRVHIAVSKQGVAQRRRLGATSLTWEAIAFYRYHSNTSPKPGPGLFAFGPAGAAVQVAITGATAREPSAHREFGRGALVLVGHDGSEIRVTANYQAATDAIDEIIAKLHVAWQARPLVFAPFAIVDDKLVHKAKGEVALGQIEQVVVSPLLILVKQVGQQQAALQALLLDTHDPLRLLETLIERGVAVSVAPTVFLPVTILAAQIQTKSASS